MNIRGAMRLPFVALLVFSAIRAEHVSTDIPDESATEESNLRVRSLPAANKVAERNWTSLSDTLDIFSARNLVRNWAEGGEHAVGGQCGKDITTYVEALKNHQLWALKGESWSHDGGSRDVDQIDR